MINMLRMFKYRLKFFLSDKVNLFWALAFPLILSTLFYAAFGNLQSAESLKTINVALVHESVSESFYQTASEVKVGDKVLFNIVEVESSNKGLDLLKSKDVIGVIEGDTLTITTNSFESSIVESFMNRYLQSTKTIMRIMSQDPTFNHNSISFQTVIQPIPINDAINNPMTINFYTAIAMAIIYGAFFSLTSCISLQANLSFHGARLSVSPYPKWKQVLVDLVCSWSILMIILIILISYQHFVLSIQFGALLPIVLICMVSGLLSVLLGYAVAVLFKFSENTKVSIIVTLSMVWSFLAGMMSIQVKYYVDLFVPWLKYLNPSALITDSFYRLYYFEDIKLIVNNLLVMGIYIVVLTFVCIIALRRNQYDSI